MSAGMSTPHRSSPLTFFTLVFALSTPFALLGAVLDRQPLTAAIVTVVWGPRTLTARDAEVTGVR